MVRINLLLGWNIAVAGCRWTATTTTATATTTATTTATRPHSRRSTLARLVANCAHSRFARSHSSQSYQEKEQSLYNDLSTLVKDAAWLKHYIASALKVQGDALLGASTALGVGEPSAPSDMSLGTKDEGAVSDTGLPAPAGVPLDVGTSNPSMNTVKTSSIDLSGSRSNSQGVSRHNSHSEGTTNPFLSSGVISGNSG